MMVLQKQTIEGKRKAWISEQERAKLNEGDGTRGLLA